MLCDAISILAVDFVVVACNYGTYVFIWCIHGDFLFEVGDSEAYNLLYYITSNFFMFIMSTIKLKNNLEKD